MSWLAELRKHGLALEQTLERILAVHASPWLTDEQESRTAEPFTMNGRAYAVTEYDQRVSAHSRELYHVLDITRDDGHVRIGCETPQGDIRVRVNGHEVLFTSNLNEADLDPALATLVMGRMETFISDMRAWLSTHLQRAVPSPPKQPEPVGEPNLDILRQI